MNKKVFKLAMWVLITIFVVGTTAYSQSSPESDNGSVTLTWQDVQELLGTKGETITLTWSEFQKLLTQAGSIKRLKARTSKNSRDKITISRQQFNQIIKQMKPVPGNRPKPPLTYLVTQGHYSGIANQNNCRFTVSFRLYLFEGNKKEYISIPLLSSQLAVSDITVNNRPGILHTRGGWYTINLKESGYHQINATFSTSRGDQALTMPIIPAMVSTLDLSVPGKEMDIIVASSLNSQPIAVTGARTRIKTSLLPAERFDIRWHRKGKKQRKKPALYYANTHSLITVAPDIIKVTSTIDLEILQSSLDTISLQVPGNYEVIKVHGGSIKNWQVRRTSIGPVLEIRLGADMHQRYTFTLHTERMLEPGTLAIDYKGLKLLDARRETGSVGIVAGSALEVDVQANQQLQKLEFHQLPKKILTMTSKPILYSFKYAKHPFQLDIAIHKHRQLSGISTVIESANATALFLPEGKMLIKIIYTVRNSYKQFMQLNLPEKSSIWSVMVDNKREKPSRNKKGEVLVPLVRSSGNGNQLQSFTVHLVYTRPTGKFGFKGEVRYLLPGTDIFINKIRMEMFLPNGYSYNIDEGQWKEEKPVAPVIPREKLNLAKPKPVSQGLSLKQDGSPQRAASPIEIEEEKKVEESFESDDREQFADKVVGGVVRGDEMRSKGRKKESKRKREILTGPVGLDSIDVSLPLSGKKFIFSRKIINKQESYPLSFSYYHTPSLHLIYFCTGFVLLIVISFMVYRRFRKRNA